MSVENEVEGTLANEVEAPDNLGEGEVSGSEDSDESGLPGEDGQEEAEAQGSAKAPEAYKVNSEFSTFGEKKNFDDWALPLVKDKDTEAKFRELFQAKYSIDRVKHKRDEYQSQLTEATQAYSQLERQVGRLSGYLEQGDFASFQKEARVSDESILVRAKQILDGQDNPALRVAEDQRYAAHNRSVELEEQNQTYQSQIQAQAVAQRTSELDVALSQPDIVQAATSFDARAGKPGAFRDEVIRRGVYHAQVNNVDMPVSQILAELGPMIQLAAPPQVAPVQSMGLPSAVAQKPVIPGVSGRGTSPTKKVYRSLDELRAKSAELQRSQTEG